MTTQNTTHPSEETILGFHSGALTKLQDSFVRTHLRTCANCQQRSNEIVNELGSLKNPSPLDQRELRYVVDRLLLRSDLIEHEGTSALYLVLQGRVRPGMVSQILGELVRPRTRLLALAHHLVGENWAYATTTLLLSGHPITQIKTELDGNPLRYRSFPRCLEGDNPEYANAPHFTRLTFQGSQLGMVKLCAFVEKEGLVTTPHRQLVSGCIVAWMANLTADREQGRIEGMVAAPSAAVASEIHRRLAWFQQTYAGLTFEIAGEVEQPVPFSPTRQHLYN